MKIAATCLFMILFSMNSFSETEPNNTMATANRLTAGVTTNGQLSSYQDIDWYKIYVSGGKSMSIEIRLTQPNTNPEVFAYTLGTWIISVFEPTGNTKITEIETHFTKTERLDLNIATTGDFLITVKQKQSALYSSREYLLKVDAQSSLNPPEASPALANYAGIWKASTGDHISIHQNQSEVIAALLGGGNGGFRGWEALQGVISGQALIMNTIYGYVGLSLSVQLVSPGEIRITQLSCTPWIEGYDCLYKNGHIITATKIF